MVPASWSRASRRSRLWKRRRHWGGLEAFELDGVHGRTSGRRGAPWRPSYTVRSRTSASGSPTLEIVNSSTAERRRWAVRATAPGPCSGRRRTRLPRGLVGSVRHQSPPTEEWIRPCRRRTSAGWLAVGSRWIFFSARRSRGPTCGFHGGDARRLPRRPTAEAAPRSPGQRRTAELAGSCAGSILPPTRPCP